MKIKLFEQNIINFKSINRVEENVTINLKFNESFLTDADICEFYDP